MTTIFFTILLHFIGQTTLSSTAELMMKRLWAAALVNVAVKVQKNPGGIRAAEVGGGVMEWISEPFDCRVQIPAGRQSD